MHQTVVRDDSIFPYLIGAAALFLFALALSSVARKSWLLHFKSVRVMGVCVAERISTSVVRFEVDDGRQFECVVRVPNLPRNGQGCLVRYYPKNPDIAGIVGEGEGWGIAVLQGILALAGFLGGFVILGHGVFR